LVEDVLAPPSGHVVDDNEAARITLDDVWHIAQIGPYASALLGRATAELLPRSVIELTHPTMCRSCYWASRERQPRRIRDPTAPSRSQLAHGPSSADGDYRR
jgi:hypothetical protein